MPGKKRVKVAGTPTAEPRELTSLYEALESNPGDKVTLLALADWLEERGEAKRATCLRWLVKSGRTPYRYYHENRLRFHHESWQEGWWWWARGSEKNPWGYPKTSTLPERLWKKLLHTFPYDPCVFKEYPTVRGAIEAVLEAWARPARKGRKKEEV